MNTIVYFHGYGSSSKSDKVDRLKARFPDCEVLAFDANIDPEIAKAEVGDSIMFNLINDMHSDDCLVFVGTSLGAWLANELSDKFGCKAILVNPCYNPAESLKKYGVSSDILEKYNVMSDIANLRKKFVVDFEDEVIDHMPLISKLSREKIVGNKRVNEVTFVNGVGHRFNGSEWDLVMNNIAKEM